MILRLGHEVRDSRDGAIGVFNGWTKISNGTMRGMLRKAGVLKLVPPHCLEKVMDPETIKAKKRRARAV